MTVASERGRRAAVPQASLRVKVVVGLALLAVTVFLVVSYDAFITIEAMLIGIVLDWFTFGRVNSAHHVMYVGIGTADVHGFLITTLCSTLVLVTPLLVLASVLLVFPRFRIRFIAKGALLALALAVGANIARFVLVAVALQVGGRGAFDIAHHYVGSILVILCAALAILLLLRVATVGGLKDRRQAGELDT